MLQPYDFEDGSLADEERILAFVELKGAASVAEVSDSLGISLQVVASIAEVLAQRGDIKSNDGLLVSPNSSPRLEYEQFELEAGILASLHELGPVSVAELSARMDCSEVEVAAALSELQSEGEVAWDEIESTFRVATYRARSDHEPETPVGSLDGSSSSQGSVNSEENQEADDEVFELEALMLSYVAELQPVRLDELMSVADLPESQLRAVLSELESEGEIAFNQRVDGYEIAPKLGSQPRHSEVASHSGRASSGDELDGGVVVRGFRFFGALAENLGTAAVVFVLLFAVFSFAALGQWGNVLLGLVIIAVVLALRAI